VFVCYLFVSFLFVCDRFVTKTPARVQWNPKIRSFYVRPQHERPPNIRFTGQAGTPEVTTNVRFGSRVDGALARTF
jgi:hypothetical protein